MMVSPTPMTPHGFVPVRGGGLFFTGRGLRTLPGPWNWLIALFAQNIIRQVWIQLLVGTSSTESARGSSQKSLGMRKKDYLPGNAGVMTSTNFCCFALISIP